MESWKVTLRERHTRAWQDLRRGVVREVVYVIVGGLLAAIAVAKWGEPGSVPAEFIVGGAALATAVLVPTVEYLWHFLRAPTLIRQERLGAALTQSALPKSDVVALLVERHRQLTEFRQQPMPDTDEGLDVRTSKAETLLNAIIDDITRRSTAQAGIFESPLPPPTGLMTTTGPINTRQQHLERTLAGYSERLSELISRWEDT